MADSLKRISKAKDSQFQDRVDFYLFQKATSVMNEETPDSDELTFAKNIYSGNYNKLACAKIIVSNSTIGANIDADTGISETDIEYVCITSEFNNMAVANVA